MTEKVTQSSGVPLRVLLVEDSADDALFLVRELKRGGYQPVHKRVETAEGMLAALEEQGWDVVFSDHAMPGFSAPAALALLRENGWSDVPFIIVSGYIGEDAAVEAMRAGAHDYVPKDKLGRLTPVVERALRDAGERRQRRRAQDELRLAEEKYRGIFENAVEGIFQTTPEGRFLTANPMMARILGYQSPEEMIRIVQNVAEQLYVEPARREEIGRRLREEGQVLDFETRFYRKDGAVIWASINARAVYDTSGEVAGFEGTLEDITERQRTQEALRESEERRRTVLTNAPVVLFALDHEGVFTLSEGRGLEAMGWQPGEGVGRSIFDVYRDEPESLEHIHRALGGEEFTSVDVLSRLDLVFEVRWSPVRDHGGDVASVIGVATDITERKRAEEKLGRSMERLVALHEAGIILGSTLEPEEISTRLLEIMRRISGFSAAAISMRDENGNMDVWRSIGLEMLGEARYSPEAMAALEAAVEREETQVFTLDCPDTGPSIGLCLPLKVRERAVGVLEVYGPEDLAERGSVEILESLTNQAASALENARLYGELTKREKRLQELVGKILVAQEEERRRVSYEVHDGLAQVAAAAHQHLQAFIHYHPPASEEGREDLRWVSDLVRRTVGEARRIIADLRPTALDDFGLKSAIRLHLDALRAEGWAISYRDGLDDERLPAATETAIFRVVQEALNNVAKHAGTKKVDLSLEKRAAGLSEGRSRIRLKVRDYGRGFVPEDTGGDGPGERVGMTGMRERITLLGGNFRVASRPGLGTLIVAEIPLLAGPEGAVAEDVLGRPAGGPEGLDAR